MSHKYNIVQKEIFLNSQYNAFNYDTAMLFNKNLPNTDSILDLLETNKDLKKERDQLQDDYYELQNECQDQLQKNIYAKNKIKNLQDIIAKLQNRPKQHKFSDNKKGSEKHQEELGQDVSDVNRSNSELAKGEISKDAELKNKAAKKGKYGNKDLSIHNTIIVEPKNIRKGAVFKGYKDYYVQDIIVNPNNTKIRRAVYQLTSGKLLIADLPKEYKFGHYGYTLKALILYQYHKMRSTSGIITSSLNDMGIKISKTQVHNIIQKESLSYKDEYNKILEIGLKHSSYIQTDDTVGKHNNKHHYNTYIGNEAFAYFKSSDQKDRVNFLEILNNGNIEYCFTSESIKYLKKYKIEEVKYFKEETKSFYSKEAFCQFLTELQINNFFAIKTNSFRKIEEAALIGSLEKQGIKDLIIMSDEAGQFDVFHRILCWVHIERNIKKLSSAIQNFQEELDDVLDQLWAIYRLLKEYKSSGALNAASADSKLNTSHNKNTSEALKIKIIKKFNELTNQEFTYLALSNQIKKLKDHKDQLLPSLENKILPLHNNRGENSIREYVMRRNISGSTQSEDGKLVRDIMTSILVTSRLCRISMWELIKDRLMSINKMAPLYKSVEMVIINKNKLKIT